MSALHITTDTFQAEVLNSATPVLVDFFATWCGPCKMLAPILEQIAAERSDVKVCKIDVDESEALAREYEIMTVPTLMVVKEGKIVERVSGVMPKEQILAML